jgi:hypothetical protein
MKTFDDKPKAYPMVSVSGGFNLAENPFNRFFCVKFFVIL